MLPTCKKIFQTRRPEQIETRKAGLGDNAPEVPSYQEDQPGANEVFEAERQRNPTEGFQDQTAEQRHRIPQGALQHGRKPILGYTKK